MLFTGNEARFGSSILISGLRFCSFPFNGSNLREVFRWDFIEYRYLQLVLSAVQWLVYTLPTLCTHSDNINTVHQPNINSSEWFVETLPVKINASTNQVRRDS